MFVMYGETAPHYSKCLSERKPNWSIPVSRQWTETCISGRCLARRRARSLPSTRREEDMLYGDATRTTYNPEPDFTRPLYEMAGTIRQVMLRRLQVLYPEPAARSTMAELERILRLLIGDRSITPKACLLKRPGR